MAITLNSVAEYAAWLNRDQSKILDTGSYLRNLNAFASLLGLSCFDDIAAEFNRSFSHSVKTPYFECGGSGGVTFFIDNHDNLCVYTRVRSSNMDGPHWQCFEQFANFLSTLPHPHALQIQYSTAELTYADEGGGDRKHRQLVRFPRFQPECSAFVKTISTAIPELVDDLNMDPEAPTTTPQLISYLRKKLSSDYALNRLEHSVNEYAGKMGVDLISLGYEELAADERIKGINALVKLRSNLYERQNDKKPVFTKPAEESPECCHLLDLMRIPQEIRVGPFFHTSSDLFPPYDDSLRADLEQANRYLPALTLPSLSDRGTKRKVTYLLIDCTDFIDGYDELSSWHQNVFYVGRGDHSRCFRYASEAAKGEKHPKFTKIRNIWRRGRRFAVVYFDHLSEDMSCVYESLMLDALTGMMGHTLSGFPIGLQAAHEHDENADGSYELANQVRGSSTSYPAKLQDFGPVVQMFCGMLLLEKAYAMFTEAIRTGSRRYPIYDVPI